MKKLEVDKKDIWDLDLTSLILLVVVKGEGAEKGREGSPF